MTEQIFLVHCFAMEQERDGSVLGEGSGVLLLEELNHAKVCLKLIMN